MISVWSSRSHRRRHWHCGVVLELSSDNGDWTYTELYAPTGWYGVSAGLVMDRTGNFYGTTVGGGYYGEGTVFKLTPTGGGWASSLVHELTGALDGAEPYGGLVLESNGNIYATARCARRRKTI